MYLMYMYIIITKTFQQAIQIQSLNHDGVSLIGEIVFAKVKPKVDAVRAKVVGPAVPASAPDGSAGKAGPRRGWSNVEHQFPPLPRLQTKPLKLSI